MIPITVEQVEAYCKFELLNYIQSVGGEYKLKVEDLGDLHDFTIESIECERLYYAMLSMLPCVLEECSLFVEDEQDYWDGNAEYYRNVFA